MFAQPVIELFQIQFQIGQGRLANLDVLIACPILKLLLQLTGLVQSLGVVVDTDDVPIAANTLRCRDQTLPVA